MTNYKPKTCKQCGTEFTPTSSRNFYCSTEYLKAGKRERSRSRYTDNREETLTRNREYVKANKLRVREYKRKYYEANICKILERERKRYKANRERICRQRHTWRANNPDKVGATEARRAQAELEGNTTTELIETKWEASDKTCILCGKPIGQSLKPTHRMARTIEHLTPIARGGRHDIDNIGFAHRSCNASKGAKTLEEYRTWQASIQQAS